MNLLFIILVFLVQIMQGPLIIGNVDRIEGDKAVILVEDLGKEAVLESNERLKTDKWYLLYWRDKEPLILSPLPVVESEMKDRLEKLQEKLTEKESKF